MALGLPAAGVLQIAHVNDSQRFPIHRFSCSRGRTPRWRQAFFVHDKETAPASISPLRVPIIRPSSKVSPMLVSMHLPSLMAVMEPPLPMWQVMIFFHRLSQNSQTSATFITVGCAVEAVTTYAVFLGSRVRRNGI